jgi:hypothetical protein
VTHATLSVEAAPDWFVFGFRGVSAGVLDAQDSLMLSDGRTENAYNTWSDVFPGSPEWVALTDVPLDRSMFFIQHTPDDVPDRYQVKDNDSALIVFGGGRAAHPARFSFGLMETAAFSALEARVQFVDSAIR